MKSLYSRCLVFENRSAELLHNTIFRLKTWRQGRVWQDSLFSGPWSNSTSKINAKIIPAIYFVPFLQEFLADVAFFLCLSSLTCFKVLFFKRTLEDIFLCSHIKNINSNIKVIFFCKKRIFVPISFFSFLLYSVEILKIIMRVLECSIEELIERRPAWFNSRNVI